jgi:hypothetical protein
LKNNYYENSNGRKTKDMPGHGAFAGFAFEQGNGIFSPRPETTKIGRLIARCH